MPIQLECTINCCKPHLNEDSVTNLQHARGLPLFYHQRPLILLVVLIVQRCLLVLLRRCWLCLAEVPFMLLAVHVLWGWRWVRQYAIGHEEVGHVVCHGEGGGVVRVYGEGAEAVEAAKDPGRHVLQPAAGDSIC